MEIKLRRENLDFLNTWPRSTLDRLLKVFSLVETEIPLASPVTETVDVVIRDELFYKENLEDFSNVLWWWEQEIGLIHCQYVSKKGNLGGYTKISIWEDDMKDFFKFGDDLRKIVRELPEASQKGQRPFCTQENGLGYLQFGVNGEKIEIGGVDNQPFKLLLCLTEPFGYPKSTDAIFEAIRESLYKKSKTGIYDSAMDKPKKVIMIQYAIKELQKGKKLRDKIKFKWDKLKNKLMLEYMD